MKTLNLAFLFYLFAATNSYAQSNSVDQKSDGDCSPNVVGGDAKVDCSTKNYTAPSLNLMQLWRGFTGNVAAVGGCMMEGDKAEKQLRHALKLNPNIPITWLCLGGTLIKNGKPEIALGPLKRAAQLAKDQNSWDIQANAMRLQSSAHFSMGQHKEAIRTANEALDIYTLFADSSRMAETNNQIGLIAQDSKQCGVAKRHFSNAVRLAEIENHRNAEAFKRNLAESANCG